MNRDDDILAALERLQRSLDHMNAQLDAMIQRLTEETRRYIAHLERHDR
jgi:hypothetical protein